MKHCRDIPAASSAAPEVCPAAKWRGREGVTLIEIVVVIIILGILASLAVTNWSAFIRNQELRQDATGFHRELLALKASALDNGDTVRITYTNNADSYNIQTRTAPGAAWTTSRTVKFSGANVRITSPSVSGNAFNPTITVPGSNAWNGTVRIANNNLNAFADGWAVITDGKKYFCIIKDNQSVNPILYHRNGTGGTWTKN
jgi:prepilin-type N-terminal cleavage/methylation domain-containing protein